MLAFIFGNKNEDAAPRHEIKVKTNQTKRDKKPEQAVPRRQIEVKTNSITIDTQFWMADNLDTEYFGNGDKLLETTSEEEWENAINNKKAAFCYFGFDGNKQVKLYNYYAVIDKRNLAPNGWHIPTIDEWRYLVQNLGGTSNAGLKLKSKSGWVETKNGNNSSNFNAKGNGLIDKNKEFFGENEIGVFWSLSNGKNKVGTVALFSATYEVELTTDASIQIGCCVRCIKNTSKTPIPQEVEQPIKKGDRCRVIKSGHPVYSINSIVTVEHVYKDGACYVTHPVSAIIDSNFLQKI